ncbi:uncharacterized protein LOC144923203 [Branchiostoma floridae x Branchiostoma belcheri]
MTRQDNTLRAKSCQDNFSLFRVTSSVRAQTTRAQAVSTTTAVKMSEYANEDLLYTANIGYLEGVEAALIAGADIDYAREGDDINVSGRTALFFACFAGHAAVVRLLIREGASLTKRSSETSSAPLHVAAARGHTEVVELLVQHGAKLDIRDAYQKTPLMMACICYKVDTVERLIELGARPDLTDVYGLTAKQCCTEDVLNEDREDYDCEREEMMKMLQEAVETKLLRCCNPTCGKPGYRSTGTLKLCGRCKLTRYCSRDCQRQHWTVGHKKCCGHDACSDDAPNPFWQLVKRQLRKEQK